MKAIEQDDLALIKVKELLNETVIIIQGCNDLIVNKQGAKQLFEVLKEWVGDDL